MNTQVMIPVMSLNGSKQKTVRLQNHTAGCPSFSALLQLEQHAPTIIIVLEKVYVIDDENKGFASAASHFQGNLF